MITISACLIVKNEEKVLARCLEGIKEIADEIIIVDTGSSDNTINIAKEYTDNIYIFQWIDDFSAARNFSISKAVMDYIYVADADEILDTENILRFKLLKQTLIKEIDIVQMYYTNQLEFNTTYNYDKELRPKLYKRIREFRFEGQIHEKVILEPVIYDSDIEICHKPHDCHAERDLRIFRKIIKEQGCLIKRLNLMYAKELYIAGTRYDFIEAKSYFEKLMEDTSITEEEIKRCQCILVKCAVLEGNNEEFFKNSLKNIAIGKASSEVCYELGEYYFKNKDYTEAVIWYYNAIYETEPELDIRYSEVLPLNGMIKCHELLGNIKDTEYYKKCLEQKLI